MAEEKYYKPLPEGLMIQPSNIHGLGLFATKAFERGHDFGISHVADDKFQDGYIRTPLGGFFNHADDPNCEVVEDGRYIRLVAIKDIAAGDELTAYYTLYNPEQ